MLLPHLPGTEGKEHSVLTVLQTGISYFKNAQRILLILLDEYGSLHFKFHICHQN